MRTLNTTAGLAAPGAPIDDPLAVVDGLCGFEERYAGTDAERRAGNWLAELLRGSGRRVIVEPIHLHPGWFGIHALLAVAGIAASLVGRGVPAAGFALALAAATFMHLDLGGRPLTPRRLLFRRASQNIVAPGSNPGATQTIVLCAGYDAPRAAGATAPGFARLVPRLQAAIGLPVGPFRIIFVALAALLPILGARMAGAEGEWLSILQIPSTVVLVIAAFALTEAELSVVSPGANDNASGVAAALATAAALAERPAPGTDVWIALLGGASTPGEAMRALLAEHGEDWPAESTVLICFDACGRGDLRFETSSGWTVSFDADRRALEACDQLRSASGTEEIAAPMRNGNAGLANAARIRGRRSIALGCRGPEGFAPGRRRPEDTLDEIQPAAIAGSAAFAAALVRELAAADAFEPAEERE